MEWLHELPRVKRHNITSTSRGNIEILTHINEVLDSPSDMDMTTEFLISNLALNVPNAVMSIPITSTEIKTYLESKVAPHFQKVQYIYENGSLIKIQMQNISSMVQSLFHKRAEENHLHPIICELYCNKYNSDNYNGHIDSVNRMIRIFQIDKNKVLKLEMTEFDVVFDFIKQSFHHGEFTIVPIDWSLNEQLRDLNIIRYFVHKCNSVKLYADEKSHINAIVINYSRSD